MYLLKAEGNFCATTFHALSPCSFHFAVLCGYGKETKEDKDTDDLNSVMETYLVNTQHTLTSSLATYYSWIHCECVKDRDF